MATRFRLLRDGTKSSKSGRAYVMLHRQILRAHDSRLLALVPRRDLRRAHAGLRDSRRLVGGAGRPQAVHVVSEPSVDVRVADALRASHVLVNKPVDHRLVAKVCPPAGTTTSDQSKT